MAKKKSNKVSMSKYLVNVSKNGKKVILTIQSNERISFDDIREAVDHLEK